MILKVLLGFLAPFVVGIIFLTVRLCVDPKFRAEAELEAERRNKEKAAKKAARRAYEREMERRDPNYKYRGSIGACGWGG